MRTCYNVLILIIRNNMSASSSIRQFFTAGKRSRDESNDSDEDAYVKSFASVARAFKKTCDILEIKPDKADVQYVFRTAMTMTPATKEAVREPSVNNTASSDATGPSSGVVTTEPVALAEEDIGNEPPTSTATNTVSVYALKLEEGKYYVGKTQGDPSTRIRAHEQGNGSEWTKKYSLISTLFIKRNCDQYDEDKETIKLMSKYGYKNVRGGIYSRLELSEAEVAHIKLLIASATNVCFNCGQFGHFSSRCPRPPNSSTRLPDDQRCQRCDRNSHSTEACFAQTTRTGEPIPSQR